MLEDLSSSFAAADQDLFTGKQIIFEEVQMFGTMDLTVMGRPNLAKARVYGTVEEISETEKTIVFKKKRRQGYQKSRGHKQLVNVIKIDKIEYNVSEEDLIAGLGTTTIAQEKQMLQKKVPMF